MAHFPLEQRGEKTRTRSADTPPKQCPEIIPSVVSPCTAVAGTQFATICTARVQVELYEAKMRNHPISDQNDQEEGEEKEDGVAGRLLRVIGSTAKGPTSCSGRCIAGKEEQHARDAQRRRTRIEALRTRDREREREKGTKTVHVSGRRPRGRSPALARTRTRTRGNRKINKPVINRQRCPAL